MSDVDDDKSKLDGKAREDLSTDVYNTPLTRQLVLLGLFAVLVVIGMLTVVLPGLEEGDGEENGESAQGVSSQDDDSTQAGDSQDDE